MKVETLKNVLQTVIHFLDAEKHIDLQNDPWNDLETFLPEFNRYREMLGLPQYQLEKRMPMTGRGDWFGRGEKVRFVPVPDKTTSKPAEKEKTVKVIEKNELSVVKEKITKTKLVEYLTNRFPGVEIKQARENGAAVTHFYSNDLPVGSWSKGHGWYLA